MRMTWHLELLLVFEINTDVRKKGFIPDALLGENVPPVPILAFIRLVFKQTVIVRWGVLCVRGWGYFQDQEEVSGFFCCPFNGKIQTWGGATLSGMNTVWRTLFTFLHGNMVSLFKATNITSLLCILSELFYTEKNSVGI